jgi:hypothetical protein
MKLHQNMKLFQQAHWTPDMIMHMKTQEELVDAHKNSNVKEILGVTKDPNISSLCLWEQKHSYK